MEHRAWIRLFSACLILCLRRAGRLQQRRLRTPTPGMTQQSQIRLGEEMMAFEIDTSTAFGLAVATRFDKHSNTKPIRVTPEKHRG
jgi:hypothetical protein